MLHPGTTRPFQISCVFLCVGADLDTELTFISPPSVAFLYNVFESLLDVDICYTVKLSYFPFANTGINSS